MDSPQLPLPPVSARAHMCMVTHHLRHQLTEDGDPLHRSFPRGLCRSGSILKCCPGHPSKSGVDQSLTITVGNDHYCNNSPDRRLPSALDRLGSTVDGLYDVERDEMADGLIYRQPLQQSAHMQGKYPLHDDQSQGYLGMVPSGDSFKRRPDYGSQCLSHREEGRRSSEHDGDKLKKISYPHSRSDDRGRDPKRSRLEHRSRSRDRHSRERRSRSPERHRNYRARSPDRRQSPTPTRNPSNSHAQEHFPYSKSKNDEFRELEIARRRKEQEERIIAEMLPPSQRELSNPTYGLSEQFDKSILGIQQSPSSGYVLHRPDEAPPMPKKSILKKRTEPGLELSTTMQFDEYRGGTVVENPEHQENYLPSQSFMRLSQHESSFPETEQFSFMRDAREMHRITEQGGLPGLTNTSFLFERGLTSKFGTKSESEMSSENKDRVADFLLPHERAGQDGSSFSRILGLLAEAENSNLQERRKRSFPDIEDEERFLYGEDEDDKTESAKFRPTPPNRNLLPIRQTSLPEGVSNMAIVKPDKEYEKIHDLLKTIGLDIGVTEISKLAARTQERLHGKKPSMRSPDRPLESHKSGSWDKRRTRNETKSPESHSQSRVKSYKQENVPCPVVKESKEVFRREMNVKANEPERTAPRCPAVIAPTNRKPGLLPTPSPTYVMPPYGQYPIPPVNYPPNAPPPNYNQYDHYLSYPAPAWPTYPPPQVTEPYIQETSSPIVVVMQQPKVSRPNLRVIETVKAPKDMDHKREDSVLVQVQTTSTLPNIPTPSSNRMVLMPKSTEEDKRKSEQKRKVLEEKEKLQKEKEARQKRLDYLGNELQKLRKQQGELLRKKRREKDGHKDPLLVENGKLQEDIVRQMSLVRQQVEETVKKLSELEKVAQILGVVIQDKSFKSSDKHKDDILEKVLLKGEKLPFSKEISTRKGSLEELDVKTEKLLEGFPESGDVYEYYDAGNHWCKNCNTICGTLFDFFTHMHNKRHRQTLDPYDRPWSAKMPSEDKNDSIKRTDKITMPAKGSEFLMPVTGFYCQLCEEFYGDQICAEDHVKSHGHNDKYKEYLNENPVYEQRRNLDRQAGLVVIMETERRRQAGLKRKIDEEKEVQKQKRLEESDERKAKLIKLDKEERESVTELEEERSDRSSSRKMEPSNKPGIKLMLKKDEIEDKKDEEHGSSFGKFSWKKPEKEEEKSSMVGAKEENGEGSKEKDDGKGQAGKSASKTIEIKLSGKTLIAHTSPWVPFTSVTTTTQAKIRPNLPVANMPLRKASGTSVNKPAPLDTFLSIRSSGASNKPLPVVKAGVLLAPEVISRAFGGEEVTLKGSILDVNREPDPLAEEPAPGVSECEQTILAVPVRPPPPPPVCLGDSSKKTEKPKTCLAAANAKDLYGIYYSSSGKSPADSRLGNSAQSAKLVHGTLKLAAGQVKNEDGNSSKEQVHSENTAVVVAKPPVPDKSNETETDEQAGRRGIHDAQEMEQCEDSNFSTSAVELQNKGDELTVPQQGSQAGKWMISTAEHGDSNLSIPNPAEKDEDEDEDEELGTHVLQSTAEQPQWYDDDVSISNSNKEVKDVELDAPILNSNAEQSQQSDNDLSIFNTVEQVKDMEIDAVVADSSAEQPQQCDDLSMLNTLEVKDVEMDAPVLCSTAEQPQQCNTLIEVDDVDATPILDSAVEQQSCDDDLSMSNLAEQVRDEIGVDMLESTADHLEQCDTGLSFPTPAKQVKDVEMDAHVLDSTAYQPEQCDIGLSFAKTLDEVTDVEVDTPVLDSTANQPEQCDIGLSFAKTIDEVKDVIVDTPVLDSTANQPEQCDIGLSFAKTIDEVKDVIVDTPVLDSTANQPEQCDIGLSFAKTIDEVTDVEVDTPVLDSTANQPEQCDIGLSFAKTIDEVKDIKVDAFILDNAAEQRCDVGFSSLNPTDEVRDIEVNAAILDSTMEQQQQFDALEQVRVKEVDIHQVDQIGNNEMSSLLQTDLCDNRVMSGPIPEQQDIEMTGSVPCDDSEVGICVTEEQGTDMRSSRQTEQHENIEISAPEAKQDQDRGGSSSPKSEDLSGSGGINISDQTRSSSDSPISTLNPAVKAADSAEKAPEQPALLQNINLSTSETAQKESSKPSSSQSIEAAGSGQVGTREECRSSGSSRTSSRRAAQAGKGALCSQTPDKTTEKRESDESENIQAPAKQLRRRSARNLRSTK
ncbi:zinc finger protein 318 [Heptranchias perlo]|uniref:zinc finger protein 318 n=1 Tax=Heptranchias perlo TaxID=212740 RepID=UPI00355A4B9D